MTSFSRVLVLGLLFVASLGSARAAKVSVAVDRPGADLNPAMWGVFFEDINFGADGGLYAELVKNRGFEFPEPLMGWTKLSPSLARGELTVRTDAPFNAKNPHYVRLASEGTAPFGLSNEGFRGMAVRKGEAYQLSLRARRAGGDTPLRVQLYGGDGAVLETVELKTLPVDWGKVTATLRPNATDPDARLALLLPAKGVVDVDFVSLFPAETWKGRTGGLRADMVQALADLRPGFLRFPGGCIVEGSDLSKRYQWKQTLGPIEERPLLINRWNYEFLHRPTPDYYQTFGLGFLEYFQLCEDIGAEPMPILNCGMACQFNSGELCRPEELDAYIQDALDLIEFANGPVGSTWGAKRAALGHPKPFGVKMLGVGNEQWGEAYLERFAKFAAALKAKYPEVQLIAAAGPLPADERFKLAWARLPGMKADIIDEHCYAPPAWFFDSANRYDTYDRKGPKVFMGEYAAQSVEMVSVKNRNTFECALAEAAFMTGMERNADVVRIASYAPLFSNAEAWQWTPDLIWVDGLRVVLTPNYHVQRMFAVNRGDRVLPVQISEPSKEESTRFYASSTFEAATGEVILKLVNATTKASTTTVALAGAARVGRGMRTVLQAESLDAVNTFGQPQRVEPRTFEFRPDAPTFELTLPAQSFTVLRLPVAR
ncbi:alpha-L-arabinofuranosidase C-terminal domain-containing protein [Opitutus sp. ER46]|uniref:alpha-L-arabinofuranosidase C-terminal domain-containing protein n=1 Tax=Opitutus sp. ER46 TaxID=2161864 RepID=UPI000D324309|nr:alpha-L-arabinofuranosidase C-terminal domain-containing protein [Opitutus sp. ER46]PTX90641.1 alpha-L-arabinofuranosidase [Opitutus sp. ER46]